MLACEVAKRLYPKAGTLLQAQLAELVSPFSCWGNVVQLVGWEPVLSWCDLLYQREPLLPAGVYRIVLTEKYAVGCFGPQIEFGYDLGKKVEVFGDIEQRGIFQSGRIYIFQAIVDPKLPV